MKGQQSLLQEFLEEWHRGAGISARTSGSTGTPKDVVLPMEQVERSARRTCRFFSISRSSCLHSAISFGFIGGKMMIARSLLSGCDLTFQEPSLEVAPPAGPKSVSLMSVVPAQMHGIIGNSASFSNVCNFLIGGSAIDDSLWDRIVASGLPAWESYGMTETASHIALRRVAGPSDSRPRFVPLPGIRLSVDADSCLIIKDGDFTVSSNDIARISPDGSFEILGRRDDIINTGGLKVLPTDIEGILKSHCDFSDLLGDFFISSLPDEVWTSRIVFVGIPLPALSSMPENLKASIRHRIDAISLDILPKKFRPKDIILMDSLPLTPGGKLRRSLLGIQ